MELSEFLEKLAQTPREWAVNVEGNIRLRHTKDRRLCPLEAVSHTKGLSFAMNALHMDRGLGLDIAFNADYTHTNHNFNNLRNQLLKACGLKENQ